MNVTSCEPHSIMQYAEAITIYQHFLLQFLTFSLVRQREREVTKDERTHYGAVRRYIHKR